MCIVHTSSISESGLATSWYIHHHELHIDRNNVGMRQCHMMAMGTCREESGTMRGEDCISENTEVTKYMMTGDKGCNAKRRCDPGQRGEPYSVRSLGRFSLEV